MKRTRSRIRLHRETLRNLSAGQLAEVAGGTLIGLGLGLGAPVVQQERDQDATLPKTNAWTGDHEQGGCQAG